MGEDRPISRLARWRVRLDTTATLAMIVASGCLVWASLSAGAPTLASVGHRQDGNQRPLPTTVSLEGAEVRGSSTAPVGIEEFSDYQCPFCGHFHQDSYPALMHEYVDSGKVVFAFRHLPIASKHPGAEKMAEAAECAGQQGKFWEASDILFGPPQTVTIDSLVSMTRNLGLDPQRLRTCLQSGATAAILQNDVNEAHGLLIRSTPTFLIGAMTDNGRLKVTRQESGAVPVEVFRRMLDSLLAASGGSRARAR